METKRAGWVMGVLVFVLTTGLVWGESLYVVSHGSRVFSFDVYNGQLIPIGEASLAYYGYGGIDLAIDNDYDILFMSSESTDNFQILDAKELTLIKTVTFPGTGDITGIVYDAANCRLLGTQRNTNDLYVFSWNPATQTLRLDETIQLARIQNACDVAINGDTLYVSEYCYSGTPTYQDIYSYDLSDHFSFIEKINMGDEIVSLDYNAADNAIYGGAYFGHQNIVKRDFDPNTVIIGSIGTSVTGIATNSDVAGRVFITSDADNGSVQWWDVRSSDPNNWNLVDAYTNADNSRLSGLAGLVVGDNFIETRLNLTKTHNANSCVSPGDTFEYTISWYNDTDETVTNVTLIDYLPDGVDYDYLISIIPLVTDANYFEDGHYYVWNLPDIAPDTGGSVQIEVTVNEKAEPGLWLHNIAVMTSSLGNTTREIFEPNVCCWDSGSIIYVDQTAAGNNNGTSWDDAYTDLQQALNRARYTTCVPGPNTIYVAQGTYFPGYDPAVSFELLDGMSVYGGFKGGLTNPGERNPKKYETILTGDFDNDGFPDIDSVVTMGDETLLDGFTVTRSAFLGQGIYGDGVDFAVENCVVKDNDQYGIYAENGNVTVKWCKVLLNDRHGIYHSGAGYTLTVENSWLLRNGECGILSEISTPTVKNSIVSESDFIDDEFANAGIRIVNPTGQPKLHNLTISNNKAEGIYFEHTDPNYFKEENSANRIEIQNCVVYFNNGDGPQFSQQLQVNLDRVANYSCIADCNSVNNNTSNAPFFAYTIDPNGVPDPNNYHLHFDDTVCKDKGNNVNLDYTGQMDMDDDGRVANSRVDIGADEVDCEDVSHPLDWNADGVVNLVEFSKFQKAWLSHDPNDPAWLANPNLADPNLSDPWNPLCNLKDTGNSQYVIDLEDLAIFWWDDDNTQYNWLWQACWKDDGLFEMMTMSGGGESMMSIPMEEFSSIEAEAQSVIPSPSEESIEEQILALERCIGFLEQLWLEEPDIQEEIDPADWKTFMDAIYQGLLELQDLKTESVQIE